MPLTLVQANPYNAVRLAPEVVASLPAETQEAWRVLRAAADRQGEMAVAAKALPKRGKATRAIWAAHDAEAAEVNDALIVAYRAFIAVAPIAR